MSKPLRLAVDGTPLLGQATGVGEVAHGLLDTFAGRTDLDLVACSRVPGPAEARRSDPARRPPRRPRDPRPPHTRSVAAQRHACVERWTGPVDVVHATFIGPPARSPVVVTIHDLTFIRFPELCTRDTLQYGRLVRRALDRGATVHATSEFVAGEVREHFAIDDTRIVQIPLGVRPSAGGDPDRDARSPAHVLRARLRDGRAQEPARARARLRPDGAERSGAAARRRGRRRMGSIGVPGRGTAAKHADRAVRLGYVSDAERRDLLSGARVLAYPSIYEGFGLAPRGDGCRRAGGRTSRRALPETLGDAAVLVDPTDVDGLADALIGWCTTTSSRRQLVARGSRRVEQYSWPHIAPRFVDLYRSLA